MVRMKTTTLLIATATAVTLQTAAGLTDTFDAGNDDDWEVFDPLGSAGIASPSMRTFPNGGYRLLSSVPAVPDGGPARVFSFRQDTELTDFYVAVDLVDWDDTVNQAVGLIGRAGNIGLGETTAYVCNYDPNQSGSSPAGQFQINYVENEGAPSDSTMAAANLELIADHSYRMIFFAKGSTLTAALYDLLDLTRPVALIQTEDGDARGELYDSGFVGLFNFSRGDTLDPDSIGDSTFDNFVREESNPHEATWPIISRGLPGIPHVTAVVPASGANFADPATGLTSTISSAGDSPIAQESVSLVLDGLDVTGESTITITEDGAVINHAGLKGNTIYSAQLMATTEAGGQLTHQWRFDTFNASQLTAPGNVVIEAENYNFDSGSYLAEAGPGTYADKFGEFEVDYFDFDTSVRSDLRFEDFVAMNALQVDFQPEEIIIDTVRSGIEPEEDYVVQRTEGGEWLNYTRDFIPGSYLVYLRAACRVLQEVIVDLVTGAATTEQTLESVGKFAVHSTVSAQSFEYFPLVDTEGTPVSVSLSGEQTLRLTIGGEDSAFETKYSLFMNYFMLLPASGTGHSWAIQSAKRMSGPDAGFELSWSSIPGTSYSVEYGASPENLLIELEDLVADEISTIFLDTDPARTNLPSGYYRVRERR